MEGLRELLEHLKQHGLTRGNFLGLLNVLIGRHIEKPDGTRLSGGLSWRDAATLLKRVRWDREAVRELGLDPAHLPPRDRQRFWYMAIAQANVASPQATEAGDRMADVVRGLGLVVGSAPRAS
jgi:hypothetical protein